jgi:UPF0042 nucleotide-binding protein
MLNIKVSSFSYKKSGIPKDDTPNGGGFVFDCRFIYNPGREDRFKTMTGKDKDVIEFLEMDSSMQKFLLQMYEMVDSAVDNYLLRNFSNLMVNFGCTGGQHRSVYAAEKLKTHLEDKYGKKVLVTIRHIEYPEI